MADFYYQTSISIRAPWLLDAGQLTELDGIIAEQWKRLHDSRERKIETQVEKELPSELESAYPKPERKKETEAIRDALRERISARYPYANKSLGAILALNGGKKLVADSLKEAIQHAATADSQVEKLVIAISVAGVSVDFEIDTVYNQISCRASPENLPESREVFAAIRDWIAKQRPPTWQSKWGDLCFLILDGLDSLFLCRRYSAEGRQATILISDQRSADAETWNFRDE